MNNFTETDSYIYKLDLKNNLPIAGFDLDYTIICPKFGLFPKDEHDWKYCFEEIKSKLIDLAKSYNIVIITNQKKLNQNRDLILTRIINIYNDLVKLNINPSLLISLKDDNYRKPNTGLWNLLQNFIDIDKSKSFYAGDAAGRKYKRKNDFSDCDYKFALNNGIDFYTPEKLLNLRDNYISMELDTLPFKQYTYLNDNHKYIPKKYYNKEIVLLSGLPCCGKTNFKNKYFNNYVSFENNNTKKHLKIIQETINSKSVIIDDYNINKKSREAFINIAKINNINIRCFYFNIDKQLCLHLDNLRMKLSNGNILKKNKVIFTNLEKKLETPSLNEGFNSVDFVNFVPEFSSEQHKELFNQHY